MDGLAAWGENNSTGRLGDLVVVSVTLWSFGVTVGRTYVKPLSGSQCLGVAKRDQDGPDF